MQECYRTEFLLSNGTRFTVIHNIGDEIFQAFDNWLNRTNEYTCESFCNYIRSKSPFFSAYPKK